MNTMRTPTIATFTPGERDYIRRELDMFFSTLPAVADGFQLKTWRGGPQAGKPKLPLPAKGLVERGLMQLDTTTQRWPRLSLAFSFTRVPKASVRPCSANVNQAVFMQKRSSR